MKNIKILIVALLSWPMLQAQDIQDALRYSQSEIRGTARFRALSGAFGALGGDLSAVSVNPAGSSVFNKSHASLSLNVNDYTNEASYFSENQLVNDSGFNLNQGGAVFVFKNNNENANWKKFSFGIAYDRTNNFDNQWAASGINNQGNNNLDNTIASYFFDFANGTPLVNISANQGELVNNAYVRIGGGPNGFNRQQAFLGFESGILEPVEEDDNNTAYTLNVNPGSFTHDFASLETGYNGKLAFNLSGQYGDNLYVGLNLNSHFINYERATSLFETNSNLEPANPDGILINQIDFRNVVSTTGNGFSFQLGGIYKLNKSLRLGLTYNSPTWFNIRRELVQFLDTSFLADSNLDPIDPNVINEFPLFKVKSPAIVSGSLAYVFGQQGLLSFDYSRRDFGSTALKDSDNRIFQTTPSNNPLTTASTYRLGGEYIYNQITFRGGYRLQESPYQNGETIGDLNGYSLGLGYNFGNTRFDLTFDQSNQSFLTPLFTQGLVSPVSIDRKTSNITMSLTIDL